VFASGSITFTSSLMSNKQFVVMECALDIGLLIKKLHQKYIPCLSDITLDVNVISFYANNKIVLS
jgi:hypothetical protein